VNFLYHNNGRHHWLEFRLIGTRSNRSAIGAKVRVHATVNGRSIWQMREISGGDGLTGQNSLHVHVGSAMRLPQTSCASSGLPAPCSSWTTSPRQFLTVTEPGGEPRLVVSKRMARRN